MTAVWPSPRMPNWASTFISGRGPVTRQLMRRPFVAATRAATVPSPPSAVWRWAGWKVGWAWFGIVVGGIGGAVVLGAEQVEERWRVHDMSRPRPDVVTSGMFNTADRASVRRSVAIVLLGNGAEDLKANCTGG